MPFGGIYDTFCSDWSNGNQYQVFDTRPDTVFKETSWFELGDKVQHPTLRSTPPLPSRSKYFHVRRGPVALRPLLRPCVRAFSRSSRSTSVTLVTHGTKPSSEGAWQKGHSEQALEPTSDLTYLEGECSYRRAEE